MTNVKGREILGQLTELTDTRTRHEKNERSGINSLNNEYDKCYVRVCVSRKN